jgi:hypothetical protein
MAIDTVSTIARRETGFASESALTSHVGTRGQETDVESTHCSRADEDGADSDARSLTRPLCVARYNLRFLDRVGSDWIRGDRCGLHFADLDLWRAGRIVIAFERRAAGPGFALSCRPRVAAASSNRSSSFGLTFQPNRPTPEPPAAEPRFPGARCSQRHISSVFPQRSETQPAGAYRRTCVRCSP